MANMSQGVFIYNQLIRYTLMIGDKWDTTKIKIKAKFTLKRLVHVSAITLLLIFIQPTK